MEDPIRAHISENLIYRGRTGDPRIGEYVRPVEELPPSREKNEALVIFGSPDDQGVILNRGRAGARLGPDCIRKHFFKMTPHMSSDWSKKIALLDFGNCIPRDSIRETHRRSYELTKKVGVSRSTLVALGGGHDFAAPHFLGYLDGFGKSENWGLINVDPHLDVRELENELPHSGTPFRQILDSERLKQNRLIQFGTCPNRNAKSHFDYCQSKKVTILDLPSIRTRKSVAELQYRSALRQLSKHCDYIGVTFDMDSCTDCEGVSAAAVVGFSAWELIQMAFFAGQSKKVKFFEIAEVAPSLDFNEKSARIAAEMIHAFIRGRMGD